MTIPRFRLAVAIVVLAACVVAGGGVVGRGLRARTTTKGARLFDDVLSTIADNYVDSLDVGGLYARAASGMVSELDDPHSVFLDSAQLARVQASITGLVGSLGLEVDVRRGSVSVMAALPNTPAEQAGLRSGDHIVAVDGRSTHNWTGEEMRRALRGPPGSSVKLSVERFGTSGVTDLTIERDAVYVRPVQRALMLEGDVGYVRLTTFSDSAALEVTAAIDSLHGAGMRRLILDLRGNPGGLLAQGTAVADLFLDQGQTIVTLKGRATDAKRAYVDEHPQAWKDLRVAVLIDHATASAAEIVAGALQDHDRAIVIGRPSYGKGSAQHVYTFHDQAGVKLTTARWYTPSGRNIELSSANGGDDTGPDSTPRPVFKTDSGRTVYGGGGIVPDVVAGDSVTPPLATRRLFAAVGGQMRKLHESVTAESHDLAAHGVSSTEFTVTPAMRDALYARLAARGVPLSRAVFDAASDYVDRQIAGETVRYAFGRAAEIRRVVLHDKVVEEAIAKLR